MHDVAGEVKRVLMSKLEHGKSGIGKDTITRATRCRAILMLLDGAMFSAGTSRAIDAFVLKQHH